jgi:carbamoyl-phosphate synthase large subunit
MKAKNILFLGAGKRVSMASIFTNNNFEVYSYEVEKNVPISNVAKIIIGKKWSDKNILQDILINCADKHIDLIVPFQDAAIELCEPLSKYFNVLGSTKKVADICHNKKEFEKYVLANFPNIYPSINDQTKQFIYKPIFGFGSRGITRSEKLNEDDTHKVVQKFIEGVEYSVDCYSNKNGVFIDGVSRIRLEVCCGEVSKSETVYDPELLNICENICNDLKIIGPSNFQFIKENITNKIYIIEINCRFGGGATFSYKSGLDYINLINNDFFDQPLTYIKNSWKKNMVLNRYYQDFIYEKQNNNN